MGDVGTNTAVTAALDKSGPNWHAGIVPLPMQAPSQCEKTQFGEGVAASVALAPRFKETRHEGSQVKLLELTCPAPTLLTTSCINLSGKGRRRHTGRKPRTTTPKLKEGSLRQVSRPTTNSVGAHMRLGLGLPSLPPCVQLLGELLAVHVAGGFVAPTPVAHWLILAHIPVSWSRESPDLVENPTSPDPGAQRS